MGKSSSLFKYCTVLKPLTFSVRFAIPLVMPPSDPAFYLPLGDGRYSSTAATVGPWEAGVQHGSPPAALLAHVIQTSLPRPTMRISRISYDFFGPVPACDLSVQAEIIRPGSRIELSKATLSANGRTFMQASAWRIITTGSVPEVIPSKPLPVLPGPQELRSFGNAEFFRYGESLEWRFAHGSFDRLGPATVWSRPRISLVDGLPISPLCQILLMVDSANGISAELPPEQFLFVPVELTVSTFRHPVTQWVGMSAQTTISPDGIGQVHADLFDEQGYLGEALQTLFVAPRESQNK